MVFEVEVPLHCVSDVFETNTIETGMTRAVPGGASIELLPPDVPVEEPTLAFDSAPLSTIAVTIGSTVSAVAVNVISSWLYDRLKSHPRIRQIRINRRVVEVTPDGIRKAVEESVEIEER